MFAEQRLWRTEAETLVPDGHPDARVLAYAAGDLLSVEDSNAAAQAKATKPAPNKARPPAANKGR